ncbi:MAG TPA: serine hydrolase domain-containing protein [Vicinamibacterales bacterium]|nr:serine hydrolase domain-containing protein [Vicinamibacterales bacterium]
MKRLAVFVTALAAGVVLFAQTLAPERLTRIDRFFQDQVDQERIGGAVALVLQDGKPVYEKAFGWADKESGRKMTVDAIFRIASQSKAITSAVILSLMEEGRLALTDPVGRYIQSFAGTTVAVRNGDQIAIVPARRAITIRDLLTHTAGISYGEDPRIADRYKAKNLGAVTGRGWYTADKDEPICDTMERLGTLPFMSHPGDAYVYGYNTDVLGCVAEKASGQPLDELIRTRITGPLGMKDTMFYLPAAGRDRLVTVYASSSETNGRIVRAPDGALGQGHYVEGPRRSFSGGAGLLSTARDYARFLEAIRRGGEIDGVRILSPRAVELMTTNQSGTLHSDAGLGYGYGFQTTDRYGANGLDSVGAFGWGGAYGSIYRVDPRSRLVLVLMLNQMPNASVARDRFGTLVYQALR